ncbi:hypothetical protein AOLI_G00231970 [Acnodon oligacanthus]
MFPICKLGQERFFNVTAEKKNTSERRPPSNQRSRFWERGAASCDWAVMFSPCSQSVARVVAQARVEIRTLKEALLDPRRRSKVPSDSRTSEGL